MTRTCGLRFRNPITGFGCCANAANSQFATPKRDELAAAHTPLRKRLVRYLELTLRPTSEEEMALNQTPTRSGTALCLRWVNHAADHFRSIPINRRSESPLACLKGARSRPTDIERHEGYSYVTSLIRFKGSSMTSLYFEEAEVGNRRTAGPYFVSKNEIIEFAKKYDPQPFHINEEAAARSVFAGLTASSAHTFSILISLLSKTQPSLRVLAGLGWDELRLPTAVRPGDELDLEATVLEKRESKSNSDRGIVRNQMHLRNQKREIVLQGIDTVFVARRPDAKSST